MIRRHIRRHGPAFLVALAGAAFLSLMLGGPSANAAADDRYGYRFGYQDDDRYEYRRGYRDDDDWDDDRYEYRNGYRNDDDDDDRYEYRSGYRDDDDRYEYRSGYRDDDDRYEHRSGYRDDDRELRGTDGSSAEAFLYSYEEWGIWAVRRGDPRQSLLFAAGMFRIGPYFFPVVAGPRSGNNPLQGSAVWDGEVLAFEADPNAPAVKGDARMTVDFGSATVDVDFTGLTQGHRDMSWHGLALVDGAFRRAGSLGSIDGAFYGNRHQAAAGHFERNALRGVFGALRR